MEGTIGEMRMFAGNFAPRTWAFCEGQLLPIAQNQPLFSIIGTIYGGDGRTNFALPDLRGRTNIGPGNGPGLPSYRQGQKIGNATTNLTTANMPPHNHSAVMKVDNSDGPQRRPSGMFLAGDVGATVYSTAATGSDTLNAGAIVVGNNGGGQEFSNMQPSLACYYIICLQGIFPSRS